MMNAIHSKSAPSGDLQSYYAGFHARRSLLTDVDDYAWLYEGHEVGRCLCCALPLDADSDDICVDCVATSRVDEDWDEWVDLGAPD